MEKIPNELLAKYSILPFEECMERHPNEEETFWRTFLYQTDFVPSKMMEAQLSGEPLEEDYSEVLEARKLCRRKINELNQ